MARLSLYKPGTPDQIYMSRNPVDPTRCACEVNRGQGGWTFYAQCSGPAKYERVIDGQTVKVCHTHRPEVVQAREAKKDAREKAATEKWRRSLYLPGDYRAALQKIADGDNDPRQTARDALDKWGDYKEPGQ